MLLYKERKEREEAKAGWKETVHGFQTLLALGLNSDEGEGWGCCADRVPGLDS